MADDELKEAVAKLEAYVRKQHEEHQRALEQLRAAARPPTLAESRSSARRKMRENRRDPEQIRRERQESRTFDGPVERRAKRGGDDAA